MAGRQHLRLILHNPWSYLCSMVHQREFRRQLVCTYEMAVVPLTMETKICALLAPDR